MSSRDWKHEWKDWIPYPYKGHTLSNPQYIKDKSETFAKNGNGWWCNDGKGWEMHYEHYKLAKSVFETDQLDELVDNNPDDGSWKGR